MSLYLNQNQSECPFTTKDSWVILSKIEQSIKRKIESVGTPLKDWKDIKIYRGVLTGCNEAFIISTDKRNEILNNCSSEDERTRTDEIIRPILRGRDIKRYGYDWDNKWLIATFPSRHYDIDLYPALKSYLLKFGKEKLEQSGKKYQINGVLVKSRKKTNNQWFETQDSIAYWDLLEHPKIVYSEIVNSPQFYLDEGKFFPEATAFVLTGKEEELKYLVKILNSDYCFYIFKTFYAGGGLGAKGIRYKKAFIEKLPIPKFTNSREQLRLIAENNKEQQELLVKRIYTTNVN